MVNRFMDIVLIVTVKDDDMLFDWFLIGLTRPTIVPTSVCATCVTVISPVEVPKLGSLQRKKIQKSKITMEVGGWVQSHSDFFGGNIVPK